MFFPFRIQAACQRPFLLQFSRNLHLHSNFSMVPDWIIPWCRFSCHAKLAAPKLTLTLLNLFQKEFCPNLQVSVFCSEGTVGLLCRPLKGIFRLRGWRCTNLWPPKMCNCNFWSDQSQRGDWIPHGATLLRLTFSFLTKHVANNLHGYFGFHSTISFCVLGTQDAYSQHIGFLDPSQAGKGGSQHHSQCR